MSYANVGKRWSPSGLAEYLGTQSRPTWAKSITIHHTASPSLAMRPSGLLAQHMENLRNYYQNRLGWSRGPHFFIDDDEVLGMTPPTIKGTHAVSFNSSSIGFELLGDFDTEDPTTGRGLAVCTTGAAAARATLDWLGLPINEQTVLFHRDDPRTSKTCPGRKVTKTWFLDLIRNARPEPVGTPLPETAAVVEYVASKTGRPYADIARQLKREGKLYLLAGHWLEGARYDEASGATIAPIGEILEAIPSLK